MGKNSNFRNQRKSISIKPTTNSDSGKGDIEFIKGKLEMQLNEIRKIHQKLSKH